MTKFYNYINEKLLKINEKDINLIYEPLDKYVKAMNTLLEVYYHLYKTDYIPTTNKEKSTKILNIWFNTLRKYKADDLFTIKTPLKVFYSSRLTSKKCKMANEVKPIRIEVHPIVQNNAYSPLENRIILGLPLQNVYIIKNINIYANQLGIKWQNFINEFDKGRVKSSIRHELTHWIDDSLHNLYLTTLTGKSYLKQDQKMFMQGKSIVNLTDREINAIVNQLDQLKKEIGSKIWNKLTWDDLETHLGTIYSKDYSKEIGYEFRKKLKKRMAREKILGKNMR